MGAGEAALPLWLTDSTRGEGRGTRPGEAGGEIESVVAAVGTGEALPLVPIEYLVWNQRNMGEK